MNDMITQLMITAIIALILSGCSEADTKVSGTTIVSENALNLASPDGKNAIQFLLAEGRPMYNVSRSGQVIIKPSKMGFMLKKENRSFGRLELVAADTSCTDETWRQIWGEKQEIRNYFHQLSILLREKNNAQRNLKIEFRAYDDGIAFRYIYPQQGETDLVIMDELTEFNLDHDGQAWWVPAYQDNRYEYLTTKSDISSLDTVHTPLTIKSDGGLYLSIHEARLVDFASMTLWRILKGVI